MVAARPYDTTQHRRLRRSLAPKVAAGGVDCARCGEEIIPGTPWDLGHDDETGGYNGPEHDTCNRSAGARKREARRDVAANTASVLTTDRLGTRSRHW